MSLVSSIVRPALSMAVPMLLIAGCQGTPPSSPSTEPAAVPVPSANMKTDTAIPLVQTPAKSPSVKDMTHIMSMDEPYFSGMPSGASPAPAGTLKKGTKVLLMTPGMPYSKVLTDTGMTVYTMTDGVDPISAK